MELPVNQDPLEVQELQDQPVLMVNQDNEVNLDYLAIKEPQVH